jgi:hypothetical protein
MTQLFAEAIAVLKLRVPAQVEELANLMPGQEAAHADRHVLIEQDAQRDGSGRNRESTLPDRKATQTARQSRSR